MRYRFRLPLLALAATLSFPALAASPKPTDAKGDKPDIAKAHQQDKEDAAEAGWIKPPVDEQAVATHHVAQTQAGAIKYTATAGTLTIRDDDAKPIASVFYVAYTADGVKDYAHRPVTFFYNGGPGSSTLWLHMGSFAPERVQTANPEYIRPAPYAFGANHDTLLDKSDLVFVDAIGTGYSRALGDKKDKDFWGVDQDADGFARAIMRYVTRNARWQSPKFIFGESYGTTRSGVLSNMLQERGMALNGVIILSSILNYGVRQPGFDNIYVSYLPSYAATACPASPDCRSAICSPPTCASISAASRRSCCATSG
jgi:carboxypeptidase C (cathepsin A)